MIPPIWALTAFLLGISVGLWLGHVIHVAVIDRKADRL